MIFLASRRWLPIHRGLSFQSGFESFDLLKQALNLLSYDRNVVGLRACSNVLLADRYWGLFPLDFLYGGLLLPCMFTLLGSVGKRRHFSQNDWLI